jgi:Ca2+-binding EF-hand superfamily protein
MDEVIEHCTKAERVMSSLRGSFINAFRSGGGRRPSDLREVFDRWDSDSSGSLEMDEFREFAEAFVGSRLSAGDMAALFRAVDSHYGGDDQTAAEVSYAEFESFLCGTGRFGAAGRYRSQLFDDSVEGGDM